MLGKRKQLTILENKISYLEYGDANLPSLIFLHGWGGEALSFQPLFQELANKGLRAHFLALDLPGFGQSPPPKRAYALADYVLCVVKYLEVLKLTKVNLISHSFGGRLAIKLLVNYPNLINKNIFIAPAGIYHKRLKVTITKFFAHLIKKVFQFPTLKAAFPLMRNLGYGLIGEHDYLEASGIMAETFQKIIAEDLKLEIPKITAPSLIFWGERDRYVPLADGFYIQQSKKNSQIFTFAQGKHNLCCPNQPKN